MEQYKLKAIFSSTVLSSSSKSLEERYSFLVILFRLLKGWLSPTCNHVLFQTTSWKSFKALFRVYFLLPPFSYGNQFCVWFDALAVYSCFWEALYYCRWYRPFWHDVTSAMLWVSLLALIEHAHIACKQQLYNFISLSRTPCFLESHFNSNCKCGTSTTAYCRKLPFSELFPDIHIKSDFSLC